jgi:hypothetical protein
MLDRLTDELLDVMVNGKLIARGEVVAQGDRFGLRIVELAGSERQPRQPPRQRHGRAPRLRPRAAERTPDALVSGQAGAGPAADRGAGLWALRLVRRFEGRFGTPAGERTVKVIETQMLSPTQRLAVIAFHDREIWSPVRAAGWSVWPSPRAPAGAEGMKRALSLAAWTAALTVLVAPLSALAQTASGTAPLRHPGQRTGRDGHPRRARPRVFADRRGAVAREPVAFAATAADHGPAHDPALADPDDDEFHAHSRRARSCARRWAFSNRRPTRS